MRNEARLLGVAIYGPSPLGHTSLRLEHPGVYVLYGLNGAGKSRLLAAILRAVGGDDAVPTPRWSADSSYFFLDATQSTEGSTSPCYGGLRAEAASQWGEAIASVSAGEDAPDFDEWLEQDGTDQDAARALVALALPERWRRTVLTDEIADQHLFAGSGAKRYIAARVNDSTPHLANVWQQAFEYAVATGRAAETLKARLTGDETGADLVHLIGESGDSTAALGFSAMVEKLTDGEAQIPERPILSLPSAFEQAAGYKSAPDWVPERITWAGHFAGAPLVVLDDLAVDDNDDIDLEALTLEFLHFPSDASRDPRPLLATRDDTIGISTEVESDAAELSNQATKIAASLMLDAPVLRCEIREPEEWPLEDAVIWQAYDQASMTWVRLWELSRAQQRWCMFSVRLALAEAQRQHIGLVLLDEPEEALHARAERHLVSGLRSLASRLKAPVVVATHSAELLAAEDFQLNHVSRNNRGDIVVHPMPDDLRKNTQTLGLNLSDILQLTRVFVLVEGVHDAIVFGAALGPQLSRERAVVIPIHGAKRFSEITDSELIFKFTSASIVAVIDNVSYERAGAIWNRIKQAVANGRSDDAYRIWNTEFDRSHQSVEEESIKRLAWNALEFGAAHRLSIVGMSKPDILEYLPIEQLSSSATSWDQLVQEWKADRRRHENFKQWARRTGKATSAHGKVRQAARSLDVLPDDFVAVLEEVHRAAQSRFAAPPSG
jgi:hypothetical protein